MDVRRAKGRSLMRREEEADEEKRLSWVSSGASFVALLISHFSFTNLLFTILFLSQIPQPSSLSSLHPSSSASSTPLPPYTMSFPRSRPLQDIPSDAASFNTQAHTPYISLVQLPPASSRPGTQWADASSGYSVPFVVPPPPPVRSKSGRGRWE